MGIQIFTYTLDILYVFAPLYILYVFFILFTVMYEYYHNIVETFNEQQQLFLFIFK